MEECKCFEDKKESKKGIPMNEMKPGQIGIVLEEEKGDNDYVDQIVMRTLNQNHFEVMNLTYRSGGKHWGKCCDLPVMLFPEGTELKIIV